MSIAKSFHGWINSQSAAPDIAWDVAQDDAALPYYTMMAGPTEQSIQFCEADGGETTIEISGYSQDRNSLYESMDSLRLLTMGFRGSRDGYEVWQVRTSGATGYGDEDTRVYRFTFETIISWRK